MAQQIIEAFPAETAPGFLLRDRDQIYEEHFGYRLLEWALKKWSRRRNRRGKIPMRND